jgi:hypothetical protein
MYTCVHVKYLLFLSECNETLNFSTGFSENTQILNSMKICPVEAKLSHVHRGTDITELIVALCSFTNGSNNVIGNGPTEGKEITIQ